MPGVVRGIHGADRGVYFLSTPDGHHRLYGKPTPDLVSRARERAENGDGVADIGLLRHVLGAIMDRAKFRSVGKRPFNLTLDYLTSISEQQSHRCALTGLPFRLEHGTRRRNPFAPSIDRIDTDGGYVEGNVRITLVIANMGRADFGDGAFYAMCLAAAKHHSKD